MVTDVATLEAQERRRVGMWDQLAQATSPLVEVDRAVADLRSPDDNARKRRTFELTKLFAVRAFAASRPDPARPHQREAHPFLRRLAGTPLSTMAPLAQDVDNNKEYARIFAERRGASALAEVIIQTSLNTQAYALKCFLSFMDFNMGWENLDAAFTRKVRFHLRTKPTPRRLWALRCPRRRTANTMQGESHTSTRAHRSLQRCRVCS